MLAIKLFGRCQSMNALKVAFIETKQKTAAQGGFSCCAKQSAAGGRLLALTFHSEETCTCLAGCQSTNASELRQQKALFQSSSNDEMQLQSKQVKNENPLSSQS